MSRTLSASLQMNTLRCREPTGALAAWNFWKSWTVRRPKTIWSRSSKRVKMKTEDSGATLVTTPTFHQVSTLSWSWRCLTRSTKLTQSVSRLMFRHCKIQMEASKVTKTGKSTLALATARCHAFLFWENWIWLIELHPETLSWGARILMGRLEGCRELRAMQHTFSLQSERSRSLETLILWTATSSACGWVRGRLYRVGSMEGRTS